MSKESMVRVSKSEYEELVRDQHKVELLVGYYQKHGWAETTVRLILGIREPEKEEKSELIDESGADPEQRTEPEEIVEAYFAEKESAQEEIKKPKPTAKKKKGIGPWEDHGFA